jgi:hypothetical protein
VKFLLCLSAATMLALAAVSLPALAQQGKLGKDGCAPGCKRCESRCMDCSKVDGRIDRAKPDGNCRSSCRTWGNPCVPANAQCGGWFGPACGS